VFRDVTADSIVTGHAGNLGYIMTKLSQPNRRKIQLQDVLEEIVETVNERQLRQQERQLRQQDRQQRQQD
jgi:hypothetical protein